MKRLTGLIAFLGTALTATGQVALPDSAKPERIGAEVNTEYTELQPVISPDGRTLYFARVSHPQNGSQQKGSQDVWMSELVGAYWNTARRMPAPLNGQEHNVLYSITPDGNTLLTHWIERVDQDLKIRGFALIRKEAGGWSAPQKLAIPDLDKINRGYYQYGFLATDGKTLLLSFSEKKNSRNADLYVSQQDRRGQWSRPQPLTDLNTDADETTPFLAADGRTLYFSSGRPGGLGQNDIYVSRRLDNTWKRWSRPQNLGPGINTPGFDAYFTIPASGDYAYLVSNAEPGQKPDLLRVRWEPPVPAPAPAPAVQPGPGRLPGAGRDTTSRPGAVVLLSGTLKDKNGRVPPNARIVYESLPDGTELGVATPDPATGQYKIVLPYGRHYGIRPDVDGFVGKSLNLDLRKLNGGYLEVPGRNLTVEPIAVGTKVDLNNVFFEFGKATLSEESFPELTRIADLMKSRPMMQVEISGHTDNVGSDVSNERLSQARAEAVRAYLVQNGIALQRIAAKGYGETRPVATNDTDEGRQQNRRVEFLIVK